MSHRTPAAVVLPVLFLCDLQVGIISIVSDDRICPNAAPTLCHLGFRFLDAMLNFLLVWFYCTLTVRESILISNGSRSVTHHQSDPHKQGQLSNKSNQYV